MKNKIILFLFLAAFIITLNNLGLDIQEPINAIATKIPTFKIGESLDDTINTKIVNFEDKNYSLNKVELKPQVMEGLYIVGGLEDMVKQLL